MKELKPILTDPKKAKIMFGAQNDLIWLHRYFDIDVFPVYDVQTISRVVTGEKISLEKFVKQHLGNVKMNKEFQRFDWARRPLPVEAIKYASDDTWLLFQARENYKYDLARAYTSSNALKIRSELIKEMMGSTKAIECKATPPASVLRKIKNDWVSRAYFDTMWTWRDKIARKADVHPNMVIKEADMIAQVNGRRPFHVLPRMSTTEQEYISAEELQELDTLVTHVLNEGKLPDSYAKTPQQPRRIATTGDEDIVMDDDGVYDEDLEIEIHVEKQLLKDLAEPMEVDEVQEEAEQLPAPVSKVPCETPIEVIVSPTKKIVENSKRSRSRERSSRPSDMKSKGDLTRQESSREKESRRSRQRDERERSHRRDERRNSRGRDAYRRSESRNEDRGRDSRSKGRYDDRHEKGRCDDRRVKGRSDGRVERGRSDDLKKSGGPHVLQDEFESWSLPNQTVTINRRVAIPAGMESSDEEIWNGFEVYLPGVEKKRQNKGEVRSRGETTTAVRVVQQTSPEQSVNELSVIRSSEQVPSISRNISLEEKEEQELVTNKNTEIQQIESMDEGQEQQAQRQDAPSVLKPWRNDCLTCYRNVGHKSFSCPFRNKKTRTPQDEENIKRWKREHQANPVNFELYKGEFKRNKKSSARRRARRVLEGRWYPRGAL
ncbi:unnamed protein product [Orchesella dallaii]|uniref:3'-5' exonuclease domain-containing protein n=1 Tax=Orchesella dallaii TaxID=48710 RepID=A0ABP1S1F4_9HEXA